VLSLWDGTKDSCLLSNLQKGFFIIYIKYLRKYPNGLCTNLQCLRLSQKALSETNTGQIVNFLSNDVGRFDSSAIYLHYLYIGPIQAAVVTVILYCYVIGPSCLAGIAILIFFFPFQSIIRFTILQITTPNNINVQYHFMVTSVWMGRIFSRSRLETEIISGMRVIKMYTWEKPFASLIDLYRKYNLLLKLLCEFRKKTFNMKIKTIY